MKQIITYILFFCFSITICNGQNIRKELKLGHNIRAFGPTYYSYSFDYFLIPNLNLEAGFGYKGVFAGAAYHFFGSTEFKATPYIGFYYSNLLKDGIDTRHENYLQMYAPIGINYSTKTFNFSAEFGMSYVPYYKNHKHLFKPNWSLSYFPNFSIKLGKKIASKQQRENFEPGYIENKAKEKELKRKISELPREKKTKPINKQRLNHPQGAKNYDKITSERYLKPLGITFGVGGPGSFFNLSADAFITHKLNLEAGIGSGLFGLTHAGTPVFGNMTYHNSMTEGNERWSHFIGLGYTYYELILLFTEGGKTEKVNGVYLPLGFNYIAYSGFTFKFEFGPIYKFSTIHYGYKNSSENNQGFTAYFSLKIGAHFGWKEDGENKNKTKSTYRDENYEFHK